MESIKTLLREICEARVKQRLQEITQGIAIAQESLENETKSSAGDKYETSREMIQQDLSRYQEQLSQAKKDLNILKKLDLSPKDSVSLGTLVLTKNNLYFLAISLGKAEINQQSYMVISPFSPIGRLLLDKKQGESFHFNGTEHRIIEIY